MSVETVKATWLKWTHHLGQVASGLVGVLGKGKDLAERRSTNI